jgi:hypothetical protein
MPSPNLPALRPRSSPQEVVDEHLDALNKGDWVRLMAQYPPNVQFFMAGGQVVKGREMIGELFWGFLKPRHEGGLGGIRLETLHVFAVGDTLNTQWRMTADFLAEPYIGTEAYVTKDGLIWAQVSTLRLEDLKFREETAASRNTTASLVEVP